MDTELSSKRDNLWIYTVLPPVILNLFGCCIFGTYYGLASQQPELVANINLGQLSFVLYVLIFIVEWVFTVSIILRLRQTGASVIDLIAPGGDPWRFKWVPTALVFVIFNAIFAVYMTILWMSGGLRTFASLSIWQRIFLIGLVPISAGFCEELIWRGYIITRLEAHGRRRWLAILLSAASFALIHGIFLLDKLLVTFLLGIVAGLYYTKERNLVPLMAAHTIVDLWSFGLFFFVS